MNMEDKNFLLSRIANHQLMFGSFNIDSGIVYGRMGFVLYIDIVKRIVNK